MLNFTAMRHFRILGLLVLLLASCQSFEDTTIATVAPTPQLAFDYRVSGTFPGMVRFLNFSAAVEGFSWQFGFKAADGNPAVSQQRSPLIYFPGPGSYAVTLLAQDEAGRSYQLSKTVTIR